VSNPTYYGKYYWCVKTGESASGEIYVWADTMTVTPHGDLLCLGSHGSDGSDGYAVLALAAGHWRTFYAASCIDGAAVAVEHWAGEVCRAMGGA
jgi:hypothetical protein